MIQWNDMKTMRYHKIQSNSMQYHTMPCNTMESIKIWFLGHFWFRAENSVFGPKKGHFGQSEPKKWGFHRCSVKKCRFSGPKKNQKYDFYAFHCIAWHRIVLHGIALYLMVSHSFHVDRMVLHGIVLYLTVLHGIALLASARGLYLARHLSTLYNNNNSCYFAILWEERKHFERKHFDTLIWVGSIKAMM